MAEAEFPRRQRRRQGWFMSDTRQRLREFEAAVERRHEDPLVASLRRPEQIYDHIEIEEEDR
jgi:hypothetical protein